MKLYQYLLKLVRIFSTESYSQAMRSSHPLPGISNREKTIVKSWRENKIIMVDLSTELCKWRKEIEKNSVYRTWGPYLMNSILDSYNLFSEKDFIR